MGACHHRVMAQPIELIVTGVLALLAAVGALVKRGKLALGKRRDKENGMNTGDRAKLEKIHDTVIHVDTQIDVLKEKTDRNAYLIRNFHGDENVDVPVDRILDDDTEFYRGGSSSSRNRTGASDDE